MQLNLNYEIFHYKLEEYDETSWNRIECLNSSEIGFQTLTKI